MKGKILFITTCWVSREGHPEKKERYGGAGYYRAHLPARALRSLGYKVDVVGQELSELVGDKTYRDFISEYDLVIVKQSDAISAFKLLYIACKEASVPLLMDFDDNYFDIPEYHYAYELGYKKGGEKRVTIGVHASLVDGIIASTPTLAKEIEDTLASIYPDQDCNIQVFPNCCDVSDWDNVEFQATGIVGWHGSSVHNEDLRMVIPALAKQEQVGFLSGLSPEMIEEMTGAGVNLVYEQGTQSWVDFPSKLQSQPWQVGIAPIVDDSFTRSKSHIKWMEYSMKKIPCIATDLPPYSGEIDGVKLIEDGVTGVLVGEHDDWGAEISGMLANPELCKKIGNQAYEYVINNWDIYKWADKYEQIIKQYI